MGCVHKSYCRMNGCQEKLPIHPKYIRGIASYRPFHFLSISSCFILWLILQGEPHSQRLEKNYFFWRFHRNRWVVTFSMDTDGWIIYPSYYILLLRYEIQRAMKLKWFQNTLTCYLPNRLKPGYMLSLKHLSELAETPSKRFPTFHSGRTMWRQFAEKCVKSPRFLRIKPVKPTIKYQTTYSMMLRRPTKWR